MAPRPEAVGNLRTRPGAHLFREHLYQKTLPTWPPCGHREKLKRGRKWKWCWKQKPYLLSCLSSLLSPTFPPSWERMEKEPRWMGPNAGPPGATPASWLPCNGAWSRGHTQPGHISPHFCCGPLWWRLLPSTLCQCLIKFNLKPKKMKINH